MSLVDFLSVSFLHHRKSILGPQQVLKLCAQLTHWKTHLCYFKEEKKYYIRVRIALVQVTAKVYKEWHQTRRKVKTLYEKDKRNGLVSYDAMDTDDTLGEEMIPDSDASNVEDIVVNRLLREKLRCCLSQLTTEERSLIWALFYEQKTEREYAEILGISQKAVNKRRYKVLTKLYRLMKA